MKPLVSIVILNYNGAHYLKTFLPSVVATQYEHKEIVVADNGSTDDSLTILAADFPTVKVLQNSTNEGFAGGYNWAMTPGAERKWVRHNPMGERFSIVRWRAARNHEAVSKKVLLQSAVEAKLTYLNALS